MMIAFAAALVSITMPASPPNDASNAATAQPPLDAPRYDLFHPTPSGALREFKPDRPDVTEGPFTVDPGHVQIELSTAEYTLGHDRSRTLDVLPVAVKLGLLDNMDVELLFTPYQRIISDDGVAAGFGDETLLRMKINLKGNDGEGMAIGLLPFVKLPTGTGGLSNGHVEGGLIVPMTIELPGDWTLSTMIEADLDYREEEAGYAIDLVHSASFDHEISGPFSGYLEYVGIVRHGAQSVGASGYQALASLGFTYEMRADFVLDAGARLGLSGDSDRAGLFMGASTRF